MIRSRSISPGVLLVLLSAWVSPVTAQADDAIHASSAVVPHGIEARTVFLDNGSLRLGVCPELGRIVWLGSAASSGNLLWLNNAAEAIEGQVTQGWANWGGDKVWPAPQSDWKQVMGWRWPPDPVLDGLSWKVTEREAFRCVIESRPSPYWGVVIRREISLDPERPVVEIRNVVRRVAACGHRVQVWPVTQVRRPDYCLLGISDAPRGSDEPWRWLSQVPVEPSPRVIARSLGQAVRYLPPAQVSTKIGVTGRWIASVYPNVVFLQETMNPVLDGRYADDASAQAYGDDRYVEMELLSPIVNPSIGQEVEHLVRWRLLERKPEDRDVDQVLRRIGQAMAEH